MSVTKKLILILIPVLVLMIGLVGILFLLPSNSDSVYVAQIAQAKKLVESGDYQNAIVFFQNAINEDSSQEEPYIELAKVYFNLNDLSNAISILREGLSTTNSVQILKELEYYEKIENNSAANELERLGLTEKAEFNEKTSDAFATYNYAKYTKDCTVKNETIVSDKYTVEYQQYNAVFEYVNSLETPVLDPSTGKPYAYARPTSIRLNKLSDFIIGADAGVTSDQIKEIGAESISIEDNTKTLGTYVLTFEYKGMRVSVGCDKDGTVRGDSVYNNIVPKAAEPGYTKTEFSGRVYNSRDNSMVENVLLTFRKGKNNQSGEVLTTEQAPAGVFSIELDPGEYTVEFSSEGYETQFYDLYIAEGDASFKVDIHLNPKRGKGIRFEVEWAETQYDTFIHMKGYGADGKWYEYNYGMDNEYMGDGERGERNGVKYETATIFDDKGTYEFHVHGKISKQDVINAKTVVKIYEDESSAPTVVSVPDTFSGSYWIVCKVKNGRITDINGVTG